MDFLKITGLTKGFRKRKAVKDVSLTVKPGEITTLFGPGGSGKSTVLRCLMGLAQKDGGQILHGGNEVKSGKTAREIGYVPQKRMHFSDLTVRENMAYLARIQGVKDGGLTEKVRKSADLAGMGNRLDERAEKLTPEDGLRLCVAEALLAGPQLLVVDEPFQGMDPVAVSAIGTLFEKLKSEGIGVLIATQVWDPPLPCDRWVFLREGTVLTQGEPDQLMTDYGAASARELYVRAWEQGLEKAGTEEEAAAEEVKETTEPAEPEEENTASEEAAGPEAELAVSGEASVEAESSDAMPVSEEILEESLSVKDELADEPVPDEGDSPESEEKLEETSEEAATAVVKVTTPTALVCVEESASLEAEEDRTEETQTEKEQPKTTGSSHRRKTRRGRIARTVLNSGTSVRRGRSCGGNKTESCKKQQHLHPRRRRSIKKSPGSHLRRRKDRLS